VTADTRSMAATAADPMAPRPFVVKRVWDEIEDTFSMELVPESEGLSYLPGQFTMLYVFGIGEVPISISGDPSRPEVLVQTIRGVGAVTRALRRCKPGTRIGVRGPFGVPWPIAEATGRDLVIVAGGIGLAPLRPVLYHALANRDDYGRVVLLYGARTPRDLLFAEELRDWRGRFDMNVSVTVDNADVEWHGSVGVVTRLISRAPFDPLQATAFVCGPEVMMRYTAQELDKRGVGKDAVFVSMERNMKCGVGFCGHCQLGPHFVCKDGPVFPYDRLERLLWIREV
jgi:NAD(P)H-flavin reductase